MHDDTCPNCDRILHGQYCSFCGQNQKGVDRHFLTLLNEAFEGLFSLQSKSWRTTFYLFFKPGFLTLEHFKNRRARYITPLRLYLITSICFFLVLSMITFFSADSPVTFSQKADAELVQDPSLESSTKTPDAQSSSDNLPDNSSTSLQHVDEKSKPNIELNVPFLGPDAEKKARNALQQKLDNAVNIVSERPKLLVSKIIDSSPPVVILLLPIFALVLKLFYLGSNRYYAQYLVLALNNHSFLFAALTLIVLVPKVLSQTYETIFTTLAWSWVWLYMVFSLKRVFEQNWKLTILKSVLILVAYFVLFLIATVMVSLLGIILI